MTSRRENRLKELAKLFNTTPKPARGEGHKGKKIKIPAWALTRGNISIASGGSCFMSGTL